MDKQAMYEDLKRQYEQLKLKNDELSKMACIMNTWSFSGNSRQVNTTPNRLHEYCKKYPHRYIYGAGQKAERAVAQLEELDFEAFVVSDGQVHETVKFGHAIKNLSSVLKELQRDTAILIVALNPKNTQDVLLLLCESNLNAIYFME